MRLGIFTLSLFKLGMPVAPGVGSVIRSETIKSKLNSMKTLLLLIRNPAASEWCINYAIDLAKDLHLKVVLFYVENPSSHHSTVPHLSGAALEQLHHNLKEKALLARDSLAGQVNDLKRKSDEKVQVEVYTAIGNEIALINQMVEEKKAHMVMLASERKGNTGYNRAFVDEVSRNVNCPVWIIPENTRYHSIDSIIYATDYQEEDISTLRKVIDLTHYLSPEITALHITKNPDFQLKIKNAGFQEIVQNKTGYESLSVKSLEEKNGKGIPEMIGDFAAKDKSSLIVVLRDNKEFFDRIFNPSISRKIVHDAGYPVLVYHSN
jgi:nucleotide-binding universal stress UspA family protein